MTRGRLCFSQAGFHVVEPVVKLWLLRMLVSLGGCRKGLRHGELRVEELNDIFGLADLDGDIGDAVIVSALRHLHRDMEDEACAVDPDS